MAAKMNWVGRRFGRLVVIAEGEGRKVTALCDCGKITHPATNNLSSGNTKSCGCLGEESKVTRHKTHGMTNTPTYKVWCGIWKRTTNENAVNFERYGGKGVTVSPLWKSFEAFLADMGERPNGMTLDRIDNDKGYVPGNCRWATHPEQRRNTSNTIRVAWAGEELCLKDIAERIHWPYSALRYLFVKWGRNTALLESRLPLLAEKGYTYGAPDLFEPA
jgi:hypothetical protein